MVFFFLAVLLVSCGGDETVNGNQSDASDDTLTVKSGYEILQIASPDSVVVWINTQMTQEEFDAIQLQSGWFKNQPREGDPDSGSFARSPNAAADGVFTDEEHFGHVWRHNATVVDMNVDLPDDDNLFGGTLVAKFHDITFDSGRTLNVLVSPQGERYVRVSRDAGRTSNDPTIPSLWQLTQYVTPQQLDIRLPNPTLNIRADNEDSFQGPVTY
jgi:hypothetical protein